MNGACCCCRFCCFARPTAALTSESNEMMVVFKSNFSYDYLARQRGFQAVVTAGKSIADFCAVFQRKLFTSPRYKGMLN